MKLHCPLPTAPVLAAALGLFLAGPAPRAGAQQPVKITCVILDADGKGKPDVMLAGVTTGDDDTRVDATAGVTDADGSITVTVPPGHSHVHLHFSVGMTTFRCDSLSAKRSQTVCFDWESMLGQHKRFSTICQM